MTPEKKAELLKSIAHIYGDNDNDDPSVLQALISIVREILEDL